MDSREQDKAKSFLARWSRRKQEAEQHSEVEAREASPQDAAAAPADRATGDVAPVAVEDLPDIESLNAESDFTVFLQTGVPDALKRRALRKLWQVDPAFSEICMLDDYNLDYTDAATVVPNLKTLYQVGKGIVLPEEEAAEAVAGADEEPRLERMEAASGEQPAEFDSAVESQGTGDVDDAAAPDARPRHPGDAIVSGPTTRRRPAPGSTARSARRRRWGDRDT
ncbi:MAG: DUF3306 domain-containing protein [Kiloniellaceae bacterium]